MIFLSALWSKFYGYILAAGAAIGLVASIYLKGRSDQKTSTVATESKKRIETIEKAKDIDEKINKMPDADLDARLNKWMRD